METTGTTHHAARAAIEWSRRGFLKRAALGGCALPLAKSATARSMEDVTIERVEVWPARYPMKGYFKFFTGPHGGEGRAALFVKVTASDGSVGWGQSVPIARWSYETLETCEVAIRDYYAPALVGARPDAIDAAHALMDAAIAPGFSTGMPIARAGVDIALWDLAGRRAGRSLAELWGLEPAEKVPLSWTVNARTLDEVDELVGAGREHGYRHFNIKVAPDPDFDVALARRVRAAAPDAFLWADANCGYSPEQAVAVAPRLADAGVDVLEAPVRPNRIRAHQALVRQGALPIYMDEGVVSPTELEEFIHLRMMSGIAMKPARCGGLTSNKAQIEVARRRGIEWLGSGLTDPDISLAATLALYAAFRLDRPAALNGPQFLAADVLESPLRVEDGFAYAPRGPGLGVVVDEAKVRELAERHRRARG